MLLAEEVIDYNDLVPPRLDEEPEDGIAEDSSGENLPSICICFALFYAEENCELICQNASQKRPPRKEGT